MKVMWPSKQSFNIECDGWRFFQTANECADLCGEGFIVQHGVRYSYALFAEQDHMNLTLERSVVKWIQQCFATTTQCHPAVWKICARTYDYVTWLGKPLRELRNLRFGDKEKRTLSDLKLLIG